MSVARFINLVVRQDDRGYLEYLAFNGVDDAARFALNDIRTRCTSGGHRLEDYFEGKNLERMRDALDEDGDLYEDAFDRFQTAGSLWWKTQRSPYWIELVELIGPACEPRLANVAAASE